MMRGPVTRVPSLILLLFLIGSAAGCQANLDSRHPEVEDLSSLVTLKVVADSEQAIEAFRMEEKAMKERFHVRFQYFYPDRLSDNLEDFLFASKDTFDIYILFPAKLPEYVERKMLLPLDAYTSHDPKIREIVPIYRNLYMHYDGHDYGVVYDGDAHLLFYRKDLFEKYGAEYREKYGKPLAPPATWEEYDRIARFLTRDLNGDGKADLYGTATFGGDAKRYIWFLERYLSMGGEYFDEEMHPLIQGEKGVKALKDWLNLQDSGATPPQAMYDWIDLNHVFLDGKVAMVVQWSDTARFTFDQKTWKSKVEGKVGFTLVPGENNGAPRGGVWIGRILAIPNKSPHAETAWKVIQYLTSPEVSKRTVTSLETINDPYRKSHFIPEGRGPFPDEATNRQFLATLQASLQNTNGDLMIPGGWEYMQALDQNIGLALIHRLSPQEALDRTAAQWEEITDRYGREHQKEHYLLWKKQMEALRGGT